MITQVTEAITATIETETREVIKYKEVTVLTLELDLDGYGSNLSVTVLGDAIKYLCGQTTFNSLTASMLRDITEEAIDEIGLAENTEREKA